MGTLKSCVVSVGVESGVCEVAGVAERARRFPFRNPELCEF